MDSSPNGRPSALESSDIVERLIAEIVERIATEVAVRLQAPTDEAAPDWMDCRAAAAYLGLHPDTLHKLAAERAIPAEQDGPGCKLFFHREALDDWRRTGGRAAHVPASPALAASQRHLNHARRVSSMRESEGTLEGLVGDLVAAVQSAEGDG
jgi:excisionase family DNA binding protein